MSLIVKKFGGSSVANLERIKNVAQIIKNSYQQGHQVVVVVSAMFGETDRMIAMANTFQQENKREFDALIATGEQMTAALLSMALGDLACPAKSYNGSQLNIITTDDHQKARILDIDKRILQADLAAGIVPVIAGFQGITLEKEITTLGRGGSDLTAVAVAALLEANECQIYKDVDGIYTSDPKIIPDANLMKEIPFNQMLEMSSLGAKVLQQRCLEHAGKHQVPIRVLSSLKETQEGTLINYQNKAQETLLVSGIVLERRQGKFTLQKIPSRPGLASYILGPLSESNIAIDMIVQNIHSSDQKVDFSFTFHQSDYKTVNFLMASVAKALNAESVNASEHVAKLSLVGVGLRSHANIASRMFSALGKEGIEIHLITSSEIKISAIIDEKYLELGARALHQAFNLGNSFPITSI